MSTRLKNELAILARVLRNCNNSFERMAVPIMKGDSPKYHGDTALSAIKKEFEVVEKHLLELTQISDDPSSQQEDVYYLKDKIATFERFLRYEEETDGNDDGDDENTTDSSIDYTTLQHTPAKKEGKILDDINLLTPPRLHLPPKPQKPEEPPKDEDFITKRIEVPLTQDQIDEYDRLMARKDALTDDEEFRCLRIYTTKRVLLLKDSIQQQDKYIETIVEHYQQLVTENTNLTKLVDNLQTAVYHLNVKVGKLQEDKDWAQKLYAQSVSQTQQKPVVPQPRGPQTLQQPPIPAPRTQLTPAPTPSPRTHFQQIQQVPQSQGLTNPPMQDPNLSQYAAQENFNNQQSQQTSSMCPPQQTNHSNAMFSTPQNLAINPYYLVNKPPPLKIKEFSGDIEAFPEFWDVFKTNIHDNPHMADGQKLQYLKQYVTGEASRLIKPAGSKFLNYETCLQRLLARYDDPTRIRAAYRRNLLNLKDLNRSTDRDISDLREFHDVIILNKELLQAQGGSSDELGSLLLTHIVPKLPPFIIQDISKTNRKIIEEMTLDQFLTALDFELKLHERNQETRGSKQTNKNESTFTAMTTTTQPVKQKTEKKPPQKTPSTSTTSLQQPTSPCYFCGKTNHYTSNCRMLPTPQGRYEEVIRRQGCINCLGSHHVHNCLSKKVCYTCKKRHHTALHLYFETPPYMAAPPPPSNNYRNPPYMAAPPPPQPTNRAPPKSSTTMCMETNDEVVLNIAQPSASNTDYKHAQQINTLLDNTSQKTFITKKMAARLQLKSLGKIKININGFNSKKFQQSFETAEIVLYTTQGLTTITCAITDKIVADIDTTGWHQVQSQFPELNLPQYSTKTFSVDLLLGSDQLHKVNLPQISTKGPLESRATTIGHVVHGPLPNSSSTPT